jgi:hypothetical protein
MTDERALRSQPSAGGAVSRALGWVGLTLVLFVVAQITALFVTSRVTSEIGVGFPEREHFAFAEALVGGLLMLLAVPVGGRVLGHRIGFWPGLAFVLPFLLAAVANYAFFEDIRSGHIFETDQALPEIFIPVTVILLASAGIGHRLAGEDLARRAWTWVSRVTAVLVLWLVGLTAIKMATTGGDFALDSPLTVVVLVAVAAYAVIFVVRLRG